MVRFHAFALIISFIVTMTDSAPSKDNGVRRGRERGMLRKRRRSEDADDIVSEDAVHAKRMKLNERLNAVRAVAEAMDARTCRYQVQIAAQTGATGLYVVVGYTNPSRRLACTYMINPWIALVGGIFDSESVPKFLDKRYSKLYMRGKPNISIEEDLRLLQKIRNGDAMTRKLNASLSKLWDTYGKFYPLPHGESVTVVLEHVHAKRNDIVVYKNAFHGNAACSTPRIVIHQDALPHGNTDAERDMLLKAFEAFRDGEQHGLDYGKHNRSAQVELEMYRARKKEGVDAWLPEMPQEERQKCYMGELDWDACSVGKEPVFSGLITQQDRDRLEAHGYIVIDTNERLEHEDYLDWRMHVELALYELEHAFNYALFESRGLTDKSKYWLSFDDDEEKRTTELWQALSDQTACERILGERFFMNIKRGGTHVKTAQGGNGMCTKSCGMGFATNATRGKAQLSLGCHEVLISMFQELYETPYVYNTHERFRVKYGTGKKTSDEYPRDGLMPCHSDIRYWCVIPEHTASLNE